MSLLNESAELVTSSDESGLLHVHDLPHLYQKPTAAALLDTLELLSFVPSSFSIPEDASRVRVAESGVPGYLTSVISSTLSWIEDESTKESVWSAASARLSERSGRNAMPAMTRSFNIEKDVLIQLHEPTLTEDNLGLKTWTSSLLLSQRLHEVRRLIPGNIDRVLELGAGTGLVGISAACVWKTHVTLTDLPEIIPNLQKNLDLNGEVVREHNGNVVSRALDWSDETDAPQSDQVKFMVILAADPIYSADHPRMLVDTVRRWIRFQSDARFIVELPLRDRYDQERQELRERLLESGFMLVVEGTDVGYDDWQGRDGRPAEVTCWWSVWKPDVP
ncbi:Protein-lysine N-methyltransferase rrg1 [Cladophialophora chaetospira]|uniref:Protein-lysine N-methyltransferase rrg1 n=1 Tax=Cladophialophora chaetospira TaxID=386627 RepID=A0AA38XN27_9EURO|nr:Protein-lysine N-methyltransferase rrg1 [Cladophialophora chaetospira]